MNELKNRAVLATVNLLQHKGCEILDTNWIAPNGTTADVVADDNGTLCFVEVTAKPFGPEVFDGERIGRSAWEFLAASWLPERPADGEFPVRFDHCELRVINEDRALVKYHENALASA